MAAELTKKSRVVAVVSGGLDSTVLLYDLAERCAEVKALSVNYGQRHVKELEFAKSICARLKISHEIADLRGISHLLAGSSLTSKDIAVPDGHYAEETMKATVVPNRNMILVAVGAAWAISNKYDAVAFAAHAGDHAIYPDCREEFAQALDKAVSLADWHSVTVARPFVTISKADIVRRGQKLGVPFEATWSCYKGGAIHCGTCGTCVERREAFSLAGVTDPTEYASQPPIPTPK